jgi:single-strand DNA-binding protein
MASFNRVIIMGNLTRDPDVRATGATGMKVARLSVAVNERRKDRNGQFQEFPVFVDVDAWDKLAELCGRYLSKGRSVLVEGRLQMDSWEKDGVRHQKLKVRAATIKFLPIGEHRLVENKDVGMSDASSTQASRDSEVVDTDPEDVPF